MLDGINPLLTGELLKHLDEAGHSDAVVVVDAHFPAARLGARVVALPGITATAAVEAIRSVLPLDDEPALDLMTSADGAVLDVQRELMAAARVDESGARFVDRYDFYDAAASAFLIIRTGETRIYGNALLRKGLASPAR
jgi:L-fucose mutarotase